MSKLKVLDLFSGIGGFSLGMERTGGFETVAFCEIEPFCRRVLAKHWPNVRQYEDVRTLTADTLRRDGIAVDVICGGFPCQDISFAGAGAGIEGERSGLWSEYARLIGELRPQFVIVENVAALLSRGLDCVLGDLAALGFDAEWHCIPASAVGAPHRRDRVWIVAYAEHRGVSLGWGTSAAGQGRQLSGRISSDEQQGGEQEAEILVADAYGPRLQIDVQSELSIIQCAEEPHPRSELGRGSSAGWGLWATEPAVGRVAHGISDRVGQLRAYGNSVVPQIPELIGRAILASRDAAA